MGDLPMGFRGFLWKVIRRFLFQLDPERAHRLTVRLIEVGHQSHTLKIMSGASSRYYSETELPQVFGMTFRSRVGLAAGFDKDAELVTALPSLGFGFAEIGTVTPRPQPGNERPRLFRDPARASVFNRMGFNGAGAELVSRRLAAVKGSLPPHFRIGVNLGKNKDTSLEDAALDYAKAASRFRDLADYLVVNVSSPNTPGLRSLQTIEALRPIVAAVHEVISQWSRRPPLLLKIAPELQGESLAQLMTELESSKDASIDGWILTNTLGGELQGQVGGWSGGLLTEKSRKSLVDARAVSRLPIISVGGILTAEEAMERRRLGAALVQIYSGWIYGGPSFPAVLSEKLAAFELRK
jgi:dihydroorotate dehydrogenase